MSELVELTGRGQPNVSQHLKEMVHAGLVAARRDGARMYYRISDPYVNRICDAVCRSIRASVRPPRVARRGGPRPAGAARARPTVGRRRVVALATLVAAAGPWLAPRSGR